MNASEQIKVILDKNIHYGPLITINSHVRPVSYVLIGLNIKSMLTFTVRFVDLCTSGALSAKHPGTIDMNCSLNSAAPQSDTFPLHRSLCHQSNELALVMSWRMIGNAFSWWC